MFCRAEWKQGRLRGRVVAKGVRAIAIALGFVAGMPTPASAWGSEGHRLVAEVAQGQLTGAARAEIDRLLSIEPGSTLASISTWADEFRSPSTASWHYVNFPRDGDCRYEPDRMCLQGSCVVGAIERQTALLASQAPDEERLKALKYVVHFVGRVPARGVTPQPGQAEMHATQRATAGKRVGAVSLTVFRPSSCM
jgi:hypothetical protein